MADKNSSDDDNDIMKEFETTNSASVEDVQKENQQISDNSLSILQDIARQNNETLELAAATAVKMKKQSEQLKNIRKNLGIKVPKK